jgi:hypothetical protein
MPCSIFVDSGCGDVLFTTAYAGCIAIDRVVRLAFLHDDKELAKVEDTRLPGLSGREIIGLRHFYPRLLQNEWVPWSDQDKQDPLNLREHTIYNPFDVDVIDDLDQDQVRVAKL